jgi:cellulose synthase/poly-beta-1,6-N-acetylglucosamine synthase-like glycosyltransferase
LDVKLIIEQFDRQTIKFVTQLKLEEYFHIICIPASKPKTKPKACTYALQFAKGEYVTVYDVEDKPDPNQLQEVLAAFENHDDKLVCVQTRLNFYNQQEGMLPLFFSIEYSMLFDFFLKSLEKLGIPIPLGGSSNHFKYNKLLELGGWDPYNVTEDADIGFRLALHGYKTKVISSLTLEEAPINLKEWINQRSRWIKGHLQTVLVHSRNFKLARQTIGISKVLGFYYFMVLPIMSYMLQFIVFITGNAYIFTGVFNNYHNKIILFSCWNIGLWLLISYTSVLIIKCTNNELRLGWKVALYPFYYLLHPVAALKAVWQLLNNPYYWYKTNHDYHKRKKIII